MIYITFTLCLLNDPSVCREHILPYDTAGKTTLGMCNMTAQFEAARMLEAHPTWIIKKFSCSKTAQAIL